MCLGYKFVIMAAVDLQLALHRRTTYRTGKGLLYTIHRDESLHHVRNGNCGILCTSNGDVRIILANMERNGETTKGFAKFTSGKER